MTKQLSREEKKKRKQQKAASKTMVKVTQPKHEDPPAEPVNLCDDCAYEVGQCDGKPKFSIDQDPTLTGAEADRVIECPAFVNVAKMPTADQAKKNAAAGPGAVAEEKPAERRRECDVEHLRDFPGCLEECNRDECDGEDAAEAEEPADLEPQVIRTDLPERPNPKRFQAEEDFGTCQSCQRPLKRTAFNRYQDAIRCTNPRCRAYRAIVKTISTGVK